MGQRRAHLFMLAWGLATTLRGAGSLVPSGFEENRGQLPAGVQYRWRGERLSADFTSKGVKFYLPEQATSILELRFPGAGLLRYQAAGTLAGTIAYIRGGPAGARPIRTRRYAYLHVDGLHSRIAVQWRQRDGTLELVLKLPPSADPRALQLEWIGARELRLNARGECEVCVGEQCLKLRAPAAYRRNPDSHPPVPVHYVKLAPTRIALELDPRFLQEEVWIDPVIEVSGYSGGSSVDQIQAVAVDAEGNLYAAGTTRSLDLVTTDTAFQSRPPSALQPVDVFVVKLAARDRRLVFATYLGGFGTDVATALGLSPDGTILVAGYTDSSDFPVTADAWQRFLRGRGGYPDGFLAVLSPNGDRLLYGTYLGGESMDRVNALAVDHQGAIYLAGSSDSLQFPVTPAAAQQACPGLGLGAFVLKFPPSSTRPAYATRLCGSGHDEALALAVDSSGIAWVAGVSSSPDLPTTGDAPRRFSSRTDGFLAAIAPTGDSFRFLTYVGGSSDDGVTAIAWDGSGRLWLTGFTASDDFPVSPGASQPQHATAGFSSDGFLMEFDIQNRQFTYATFYGGSGDDFPLSLTVDSVAGLVTIGGNTTSSDLPLPAAPCVAGYRGRQDAFVAWFRIATRTWGGLYLGGRDLDELNQLVAHGSKVFVAGRTASPDFPRTFMSNAGALHDHLSGPSDGFIAIVDPLRDATLPCIAPAGVVNSANYLPGPVAPGEFVTIFGAGLGPERPQTFSVVNGRVPTELGGVRVSFDGVPAPVLYASFYQLNVIVPYGVAGKEQVPLRIEHGMSSVETVVPVAPASPAIFSLDGTGTGQAAVLNEDNTVNSPANPAVRGTIVQIFAHGQGRTIPAGIDGLIVQEVLPQPELPVEVWIGGKQAELHYAGAAPGLVSGVLQVNAKIPTDIQPGVAVPVVLKVGEWLSPPTVTVAVR